MPFILLNQAAQGSTHLLLVSRGESEGDDDMKMSTAVRSNSWQEKSWATYLITLSEAAESRSLAQSRGNPSFDLGVGSFSWYLGGAPAGMSHGVPKSLRECVSKFFWDVTGTVRAFSSKTLVPSGSKNGAGSDHPPGHSVPCLDPGK